MGVGRAAPPLRHSPTSVGESSGTEPFRGRHSGGAVLTRAQQERPVWTPEEAEGPLGRQGSPRPQPRGDTEARVGLSRSQRQVVTEPRVLPLHGALVLPASAPGPKATANAHVDFCRLRKQGDAGEGWRGEGGRPRATEAQRTGWAGAALCTLVPGRAWFRASACPFPPVDTPTWKPHPAGHRAPNLPPPGTPHHPHAAQEGPPSTCPPPSR